MALFHKMSFIVLLQLRCIHRKCVRNQRRYHWQCLLNHCLWLTIIGVCASKTKKVNIFTIHWCQCKQKKTILQLFVLFFLTRFPFFFFFNFLTCQGFSIFILLLSHYNFVYILLMVWFWNSRFNFHMHQYFTKQTIYLFKLVGEHFPWAPFFSPSFILTTTTNDESTINDYEAQSNL